MILEFKNYKMMQKPDWRRGLTTTQMFGPDQVPLTDQRGNLEQLCATIQH